MGGFIVVPDSDGEPTHQLLKLQGMRYFLKERPIVFGNLVNVPNVDDSPRIFFNRSERVTLHSRTLTCTQESSKYQKQLLLPLKTGGKHILSHPIESLSDKLITDR